MSGGGTAGHIYPALTVAEELAADGRDEVAFVGTPSGLEARLVAEAGIPFFGVPARGFDRSRPFSLVSGAVVSAISTLKAIRILRSWRPDVVVGFGAYVSIPVGLAAVLKRIPLVLQEQNSVPGLTNRLLSRWARSVALTYENSRKYLRHPERADVTGNPVRKSVREADRSVGRSALGLPDDATVLLVFGGSRGARHINQAVAATSARILSIPDVRVVHVAGRAEFGSVVGGLAGGASAEGERWTVLDYAEDMGGCIAAADVVVARAGATSLAEITTIGRAAVLVPYPYATDDHQTLNAQAIVEGGGAICIPDADLDDDVFGDAIVGLLEDADARATMAAASSRLGRPDAGERVARMVREAAHRTREADL